MPRCIALVLAVLLAGCSESPPPPVASKADRPSTKTAEPASATFNDLDDVARQAVLLSLAMTPHDPAFVDAYFGPEGLRDEAVDEPLELSEIRSGAEDLLGALDQLQVSGARAADMRRRLVAMITRIDLIGGVPFRFNEETELLYDAVAPDYSDDDFRGVLARIDALIGGEGPLAERVPAFRASFAIPPDQLSAVFNAAIEECRRRTLEHMDLPAGESFTVEYVNDKPWSGYNWYQGGSKSLIQVNTDLPIFIHRAVDLGCHEGYPGHHTYNALLEQQLVNQSGWVEFSLYPLFSPQSLIAEGSANYGIELAFPGPERLEFEREVLFPLAGLDPVDAERYYELLELLAELDHVDNHVARAYLDGEIDRATAEAKLVEFKLVSPERASQRVDFFETYRGYVINYNLGKDLVADYIARTATSEDGPWGAFTELLSKPISASGLRAH